MSAAVVVPTIREQSIRRFLDAWRQELADARIIVVEDNPARTFSLSGANVIHYAWQDIDRELGDHAWIIPRRTDCIRSFGLLKAAEGRPEMIATLDDDCLPIAPGFLDQHSRRLAGEGADDAWAMTGSVPTRGYPYETLQRTRPCWLSHGLWQHCPDFDAPMALTQRRTRWTFESRDQTVPVGRYFPMCGMNVAFRPGLLPAMYFLLMGRSTQRDPADPEGLVPWPYDRFGDIWCGVLVKKVCDHLGYAVWSGAPAVRHERASNVWDNLAKEATGLRMNETFWQAVDLVVLRGATVGECYKELAEALPPMGGYGKVLSLAMRLWVNRAEAVLAEEPVAA